jgi:hypothetical protein
LLKDPTETPTDLDWAWAAGIYEGEGHASARPTTTYCEVAQKDDWLTNRFLALFGGSVKVASKGRKHHLNHWYLTGDRARTFLRTIMPLLSPWRREQATRAINFKDDPDNSDRGLAEQLRKAFAEAMTEVDLVDPRPRERMSDFELGLVAA